MNRNTVIKSLTVLALTVSAGCTNLDEKLYSTVGSDNYYNTKGDVESAVGRPFEHAFATIQERQVLQELTADQLITPTCTPPYAPEGGTPAAGGADTITIPGTLRTARRYCISGTASIRV